jgi:flagellar biosynthetic protein FlhB
MADVDQDQKTEEATPRKKEQLREKGQVAKSADVAGAATVVAVVGALAAMGDGLRADVSALARRALSLRDAHRPLRALEAFGDLLFTAALPIAGVAAVAAVGATVAQTRGLFALASLQPKPERLDPVQGLKKVLPGPQMAAETGKSLLKVAFVAVIVWRIVDGELPRFAALPSVEAERAAAEVGAIAGRLVLHGVAGLVVLAGLDYAIAWRRFQKQARMAKHEVKEEHKQTEGDPQIKAKRRAKQRELAESRSIAGVEGATVLVTNPTHIAVALRYDADRGDAAPVVLAQGVDEVALRMRAKARELGIPIVENRPLARALKATARVGQPIPVELYEAAARVIAHVMSIGATPRRGEA